MMLRRTAARWLPLAAVAAALALAGSATGAVTFTREPDIDRSGNDMAVMELAATETADDCAARCAATKGCVAFTYVKQSSTVPKPVCRLKNEAPYGHQSSCCISGVPKN